jgi:ABC-2 type transport system ATP-binding protein
VLALRGIEKRFGERRALAGVTLAVSAGEAVLLVGRNGAGKTTLLRIATGFLDADAGDVTIDGISLSTNRTAAQQKLGYLPEQAPAPVELTVRDHLMFRARQKRVGRDAVLAAAKTVQIESELDRPIGALSKGYRQRVPRRIAPCWSRATPSRISSRSRRALRCCGPASSSPSIRRPRCARHTGSTGSRPRS